MLSSREVLAGLTAIANQAVMVAFIWHAFLFAALVAFAGGWRLSRRSARSLIAVPVASVASFAFAFDNPFNGAVLAVGAVALAALAGAGERGMVSRGPAWQWWAGVALVVLGWVYPHFLYASLSAHLYAAPLGLVPAPTLSVAMGLALLGGLGTRCWGLTLSALGLFYGVLGVLWLGVHLDAGLVIGAIALVVAALSSPSTCERSASASDSGLGPSADSAG
jgi:hypothetical protein